MAWLSGLCLIRCRLASGQGWPNWERWLTLYQTRSFIHYCGVLGRKFLMFHHVVFANWEVWDFWFYSNRSLRSGSLVLPGLEKTCNRKQIICICGGLKGGGSRLKMKNISFLPPFSLPSASDACHSNLLHDWADHCMCCLNPYPRK